MLAGVYGMPWPYLRAESTLLNGEREARLAMEMLPPLAKKQKRPHVVDVRYRFAKKRFDDEYKWTPTPEIQAAIVEAIFGKDRG